MTCQARIPERRNLPLGVAREKWMREMRCDTNSDLNRRCPAIYELRKVLHGPRLRSDALVRGLVPSVWSGAVPFGAVYSFIHSFSSGTHMQFPSYSRSGPDSKHSLHASAQPCLSILRRTPLIVKGILREERILRNHTRVGRSTINQHRAPWPTSSHHGHFFGCYRCYCCCPLCASPASL